MHLTKSKPRVLEIWHGINRSGEVDCVSHYSDGSLRMRGRDGLPYVETLKPGQDAEGVLRRFFDLSYLVVLPVSESSDRHPLVLALHCRAQDLRAAALERAVAMNNTRAA